MNRNVLTLSIQLDKAIHIMKTEKLEQTLHDWPTIKLTCKMMIYYRMLIQKKEVVLHKTTHYKAFPALLTYSESG